MGRDQNMGRETLFINNKFCGNATEKWVKWVQKNTIDGYSFQCIKCHKEYFELNNQKLMCVCGKMINSVNLKEHMKRNIHHKWLRIKNQKLSIVQ
jgi:hypothetical protein